MENSKSLAILILMGGKSTRFGTEKPIIELYGKPLILHQLEILYKFDQDIFLVAHSEEQIFNYRKQIDFPKGINFFIDDRAIFSHPKIYKPMVGIYSGFKELKELGFKKAFLLSCDMPLIKPKVMELMINESHEFECCIPRWNNGYLEYLFAIYPVKKGYRRAKEILIKEDYGIMNFFDPNWNINYISVEKTIRPLDKNLVSLININGPIDLVNIVKMSELD
ncbi:MAG: molybdenum cofactor guanylyltransferase [Candidatus Thorarchaeota archaeon]